MFKFQERYQCNTLKNVINIIHIILKIIIIYLNIIMYSVL